ncbi:hypothetical protein [Chitinilyticum piscinae]|uniref:Uncharacterized protein n=1 Tax=Chitinilyticum piscinae TaxID=2866724 RepID=A0A8J7FLM4_9NEIS|nr:hypothetical protein [Chitinilyticum piscinae]MBE9610352.1 hypothetical protein [Chitinilyticum piscinae]
MAKYQFFRNADQPGSTVLYLCTDSSDFLMQKDGLLAQGYEVEGDMIVAASAEAAIAQFRHGAAGAALDASRGYAMVGALQAVVGLAGSALDRMRGR